MSLKVGDRVIQIPRDGWPSREGTITEATDDGLFRIQWDDGRTHFIHPADMVPMDLWLVKPDQQEQK